MWYLIEQIIADRDDSSETNFQTSNTHTTKTPYGEKWDELETDCNWTLIEKGISVLNKSMTLRHIFMESPTLSKLALDCFLPDEKPS